MRTPPTPTLAIAPWNEPPPLRRVILAAAGHRTGLLIAAASIIAAIATGVAGLTLAGAAAYLAIALLSAASPRFWRRIQATDTAAARRLPRLAQLDDPSLKIAVRSIKGGKARIARMMRRIPASVRREAREAVASLGELEALAARLVRQADELGAFLFSASPELVALEITRLIEAIQHERNDEAREEYSRALAVRRDQLAAIDRVAKERERICAALQRVVGAFEALPAWIQRLQVLDARAKEDVVAEVDERLNRMAGKVNASQRLLEELVELPRAASAG